jgi:hypothetical protein
LQLGDPLLVIVWIDRPSGPGIGGECLAENRRSTIEIGELPRSHLDLHSAIVAQ